MDEKYIVQHLIKFCDVMYKGNESFANYSKRRDKYIFGCIKPFGKITKNVVHRSVAIFVCVGNLTKE